MKIKVPALFRVIIHPYEVVLKHCLKDDDGYRGDCNIRTQQVRIDPALPYSQRVYVLMHEVGEAIKDAYNCGVTHDDLNLMSVGYAEFMLNTLGIEFDWAEIKEIK